MVINIYVYIDRCPSNRRNCINEKRKFKLLFSTVSDTFQLQCTCKTIVLTTVPATGTRFNSSHSSPALRQPLSYILLSPVCIYQVQTKWLKKPLWKFLHRRFRITLSCLRHVDNAYKQRYLASTYEQYVDHCAVIEFRNSNIGITRGCLILYLLVLYCVH